MFQVISVAYSNKLLGIGSGNIYVYDENLQFIKYIDVPKYMLNIRNSIIVNIHNLYLNIDHLL